MNEWALCKLLDLFRPRHKRNSLAGGHAWARRSIADSRAIVVLFMDNFDECPEIAVVFVDC